MKALIEGVGANALTVESPNGAKQSHSPYRMDLMPPLATLAVAGVLAPGAIKYGENNWRGLPVKDHLNHALVHVMAFLAGDTQDDHLGHFACRAMMALETYLIEQLRQKEQTSNATTT